MEEIQCVLSGFKKIQLCPISVWLSRVHLMSKPDCVDKLRCGWSFGIICLKEIKNAELLSVFKLVINFHFIHSHKWKAFIITGVIDYCTVMSFTIQQSTNCWYYFSFPTEKWHLTFHANCQRRQFAGNVKAYLGKMRKNISKCRLQIFSSSLLDLSINYKFQVTFYSYCWNFNFLWNIPHSVVTELFFFFFLLLLLLNGVGFPFSFELGAMLV